MPTDPAAWPSDRLCDEVAFTISPIGRQRREDREVAFALEIERLRVVLRDIVACQERYARDPGYLGFDAVGEMSALARAALAGREG